MVSGWSLRILEHTYLARNADDLASWLKLEQIARSTPSGGLRVSIDIMPVLQALYGGGLKYAKALDLLGPGWIVELDHNAANSMGSNLAGWRFGI